MATIDAVPTSTQPRNEVPAPTIVSPLEVEQAPDAAAEDESQYPQGFRFFLIFSAGCLSVMLIGLDGGVLATAVPTITSHFGTIADVGWYYSASRLTGCSFQFLFGKLYTVYPTKWVYLASLVILSTGSLLATLAPSSKALVVARAISGLGASGLITGAFVLLANCVPVRSRALYGSIAGASETVMSTIAPLLAGVITEKISWRFCFGVNLPLCVLTACLMIFSYQEGPEDLARIRAAQNLTIREKMAKLDLLGTAIFVPGITCLLLALQWGGSTYSWTDPRIISMLVLFAMLIMGFGYWQYRLQDAATLPPRILGNRNILAGMLFCCCTNAALAVVDYYLPIYFQAVKGKTPAQSGVLTIPLIVGLMLACILSGSLTTAVGYYVPFMLLSSVSTPIAIGLLTTLEVDTQAWKIAIYQAFFGAACGIGLQGPQVAAQTVLSAADVPIGVACIMFAHNLGPALFVAIAQTVFTTRLITDLHENSPSLNGTTIENTGLSSLRQDLEGGLLQAALLGYDKAVTQTFYLPVALGVVSLVGAAFMQWRNVKEKQT